MTQYKDIVEKRRLDLAVQKWSKEVQQIHIFDSNTVTMAYDYPNPRRDGYVEDISYNDGTVKRTILSTKQVLYLGEEVSKLELMKRFWRRD
tara:strand:- start:1205 stop:1477 length:273 start_codon:yes stop_codon:yes gene_type:complete